MSKINYLFILIIVSHQLIVITKCGILDFLSLDEDDAPAQKRDRESDCLCQKAVPDGSNCICCLEFNFTNDLDIGPACVKVNYISQLEGVGLNLTLGKTLAKSAIVKVEKPEEPVCLSILGGLAKMCAKFNGLTRSANGGLIGCLKMQPKLFGEVPIDFDFPCFDLNSEEIRVIEAPKKVEEGNTDEAAVTSTETDSEETIGGFKVEDILNVVSKTADQGIKIIYEFFGSNEEKPETPTEAESKTTLETATNTTKAA